MMSVPRFSNLEDIRDIHQDIQEDTDISKLWWIYTDETDNRNDDASEDVDMEEAEGKVVIVVLLFFLLLLFVFMSNYF